MADPFGRPALHTGIFYKDPQAALGWLEKAFGFKRSMLLTDKDGALAHCELRLGEAHIYLGYESDNMASPASVGGKNTQSVYILLNEGLDAHCERARAAGAEILSPPEDQYYGDRSYMARDPEGHIWGFGQNMRSVSKEEAEQVTGLKIEGWTRI